MGLETKPWRCPECKGSWFKQEKHMRLAKGKYKALPGMEIPVYNELGETGYATVYICIQCDRVLREIYED